LLVYVHHLSSLSAHNLAGAEGAALPGLARAGSILTRKLSGAHHRQRVSQEIRCRPAPQGTNPILPVGSGNGRDLAGVNPVGVGNLQRWSKESFRGQSFFRHSSGWPVIISLRILGPSVQNGWRTSPGRLSTLTVFSSHQGFSTCFFGLVRRSACGKRCGLF
jgi:hypothetical protein